jgi:hypothetical protein
MQQYNDMTEYRQFILSKLIKIRQSGNASEWMSLNIFKSVMFDILIEHGDKDMLIFYMDEKPWYYNSINLDYIIQYSIKYSKKYILDHVLSECDTASTNIDSLICRYGYQYNNKEYLNVTKETQFSALYGACLGDHPFLVKTILKNAVEPFTYNNI